MLPQLNALNGTEMIEFMLASIRKKLEDSGEFHLHTTFPLFRLDYKLSIASYPQQDLEDAPKIKVEGTTLLDRREDRSVKELSEPIKTEIEASIVVDTPDKARVEAHLPVPTPSPGPGGVIVDKPVSRMPKVGNKKH